MNDAEFKLLHAKGHLQKVCDSFLSGSPETAAYRANRIAILELSAALSLVIAEIERRDSEPLRQALQATT